jgi:hypothetical protein
VVSEEIASQPEPFAINVEKLGDEFDEEPGHRRKASDRAGGRDRTGDTSLGRALLYH